MAYTNCDGCQEVIKKGKPEVRISVTEISKDLEGYAYFFCVPCGEQIKEGILWALIGIHSVLYAEGKWPPGVNGGAAWRMFTPFSLLLPRPLVS